jgi:hypothetical protein
MAMKLRNALIKKAKENRKKLAKQLKDIDNYVKKLEKQGVKKLRFEVVEVSEDFGVLSFTEFEEGDEIDIEEFREICRTSLLYSCSMDLVDTVVDIIKEFDEVPRFDFYGYDLDDKVDYEEISELVDKYVGSFDFYVDDKGRIVFTAGLPAGRYGWVVEEVVLVPVTLEESMLRRRSKGKWV